MKYRVIVTPQAQVDIRRSFQYLHERAPLNAARWLQALHEQIMTLERFPARCGIAQEQDYIEEDLQQLLFKSHRIVFWIDALKKTVFILLVRHRKRQPARKISKT